MTKTKLFVPLFVILVMGMATSAFAQYNCAVASGTTSRATITGHTEAAGDISFTCTTAVATPIGQATVTIGYPVLITNNVAYPVATPVRITDLSGSFTAAIPTVSTVTNTGSQGQVVINIPAHTPTATSQGFTVRGVLVSLVGSTAASNLQATISVSPPLTAGANVLINSGDNTPTVITSIMPGINTTTAAPSVTSLPALYLGNGTNNQPTRAGFVLNTTENYIDMFKSAFNMSSNTATNSTELLYTFSGMAPGSTIGPCTPTINTAGVTLATLPATGVTAAASAAGTATITVQFTGGSAAASPSQTAVETVTLTCTPGFNVAGATLNPITSAITATVSLNPAGAALGAGGVVLVAATTGQIPRYASTPISVGTAVLFTPATTTLLIPYVTSNGDANPPAGSFDTGISIANMTANPASFTTGGASAQAGTVAFTLFPADGTASFTVLTASVPSGGSFIANVSDLMKAATPPKTGTFSGSIIAVANFTNAHGAAFVYGGTAAGRLTSTTDVLVIPSPFVQARSGAPAIANYNELTTK